MSRAIGPLRKILPAAAVGLAALLGAVGCGSGQVTQTDSVEPAVDGNQANIGSLALRDVLLAYPESGGYRKGDSAPLQLSIVNTGETDDRLVSVSSPASGGDVELIGDASVPGGTSVHVIAPDASAELGEPSEPASESAPASSAPKSPATPAPTTSPAPAKVGTMSVVLTNLTMDLPIGRNIPVTFVFAHAGTVTVQVPTAAPGVPGVEPTDSGEE